MSNTLSETQNAPLAVSPADAARLIGLGRTKLYEELNSGAIRSFTLGKRRLIPMTALHDWLDRKQRSEACNDAA